ncbi:hypothetical protein WBU96_28590 [Bacillus albus]
MSTAHLTVLELIGLMIGIVIVYCVSALVGYGSVVLIDKIINRNKGRR